ncbi:hypothetical protein ACM2L8_03755, partial [Escherichia coli]
GPKTSIICSPMTSLKTSIKTITYLSDIGCLEIQGASLRIQKAIQSPHKQLAFMLCNIFFARLIVSLATGSCILYFFV